MTRTHDPVCPHRAHPRFERKPVISSSYRNRLARRMPEEEEPEATPDYQVAGPLSPAANGAYYETGTHNGQPYYRRKPGQPWFIWVETAGDPVFIWNITKALGSIANERWSRTQMTAPGTPPGAYAPAGGAVGTAIVTAY